MALMPLLSLNIVASRLSELLEFFYMSLLGIKFCVYMYMNCLVSNQIVNLLVRKINPCGIIPDSCKLFVKLVANGHCLCDK